MRVAIVGCGLIGVKRAEALGDSTLVVCCDPVVERAERLAAQHGAEVTKDWQEVARRGDVDIVMVATTHDMLAAIAAGCAGAGKHVLIEKPGARRAAELDAVREAAARTGAKVRVGFNHRCHRALRKAHEIVASGGLGDLLFVRGRYGHGGRSGYEQEWRARPEVSGGGEMLDQGSHLIDLARWYLGAEFTRVQASAPTYFWNMPVEDNAFLLLTTGRGQTAFLHASWTEWKNTFSFEIYGRVGKLEVSGLGGSYGVERLAHYAMSPAMGPPETTIWEYPMADDSWQVEFAEFLTDIREGREPDPGVVGTQAVLQVIERAYAEGSR